MLERRYIHKGMKALHVIRHKFLKKSIDTVWFNDWDETWIVWNIFKTIAKVIKLNTEVSCIINLEMFQMSFIISSNPCYVYAITKFVLSRLIFRVLVFRNMKQPFLFTIWTVEIQIYVTLFTFINFPYQD